MRIAVCLSGQLRTGIEAAPNILRYFGDLLSCIDFFIHTWDADELKGLKNGPDGRRPKTQLTEQQLTQYRDIYSPKAMLVENFEQVQSTLKAAGFDSGADRSTFWPLMYSWQKSVLLKSEYESTQGERYDVVIKLRSDIIFAPQRSLQQDLECLLSHPANTFLIENYAPEYDQDGHLVTDKFCDDVYWMSSSQTMDIAAQNFNETCWHHRTQHLLQHLQKHGITAIGSSNSGYSIYRHECLSYSPISEYEQCFGCDYRHYQKFPNMPADNRTLVVCGDDFTNGIGCFDRHNEKFSILVARHYNMTLVDLSSIEANIRTICQQALQASNMEVLPKLVIIDIGSYETTGTQTHDPHIDQVIDVYFKLKQNGINCLIMSCNRQLTDVIGTDAVVYQNWYELSERFPDNISGSYADALGHTDTADRLISRIFRNNFHD